MFASNMMDHADQDLEDEHVCNVIVKIVPSCTDLCFIRNIIY